MIIEIEERTLENMQDDINGYIDLISRYDKAFLVKNELIKGYEAELKQSKQIMLELIKILSNYNLNDEQKAKIAEIKQLIEEGINL